LGSEKQLKPLKTKLPTSLSVPCQILHKQSLSWQQNLENNDKTISKMTQTKNDHLG
jgi:hypothetical protein